MRQAKVVIGANWGDEGKGLVTDYLAGPSTMVVRFNGGAQAGHTVETPEGHRHVFHHFGSGTLRGAATYLSRFFIANPLMYFEERDRLARLGVVPRVIMDPESPVTTPYDMMLNQIVEEHRGAGRHGSCGLGINETIRRHASIPVHIQDAGQPGLEDTIRRIAHAWVPEVLQGYGIVATEAWKRRLGSEEIMTAFLDMLDRMACEVTLAQDCLRTWAGEMVFEGAQGLLLDQNHRWFPHVTHSATGLANVDVLAREAGIERLEVTYVSRAYATRHGAGPLPSEVTGLQYPDATNVPNLWQGGLRFGHLDLDLLAESVRTDLAHASLPVAHRLAITCLDQVQDHVTFVREGTLQTAATNDFIACAKAATGSADHLASHGPTRATIMDSRLAGTA